MGGMYGLGAAGLRMVMFVVGWINRLLIAFMAAYLAALGITFLPDYTRYAWLKQMVLAVNTPAVPLQNLLKGNLPTRFGGFDMTPALVLIIVFVVWFTLEWQWVNMRNKANELKRKKEIKDYNRKIAAAHKSAQKQTNKAHDLSAQIDPSDREKLLELYANTKKALEEQKKLLSFLSIDVVGSTKMKEDEDAAIASRDFARYKEMVEGIIKRHKYLKASWTPDGVMICFRDTEHAVKAGQDVLRELERFNREIKAMKTDFKVRIGINSGSVLYDEKVPMEEMSDRVIDIAGHMQKYAAVNSIFINKESVAARATEFGFVPSSKIVDGCEVFEWKPM